MRSDLHVHSHYSDGSDTVTEVLDKAKEAKIDYISFVDHDTVDTYAEAKVEGDKRGIHVIPGIEISAYDFKRQRKVHILGYNYNEKATNIKAICDDLLDRRNRKTEAQLKTIIGAGYAINWGKLNRAVNSKKTMYKQHIMEALTEAPYESARYQSLYKLLFKGKGICAGDIEYIDVHLAVKAIKADEGIAVIAHPGQLDSYELIPELLRYGLDGIEVYHPDHTEEDIEKSKKIAETEQLLELGGSDYHGRFWIEQKLGIPEFNSRLQERMG